MANGAKKAAKNLRDKKENPDSWKEWTGARPKGDEGAGGLLSKNPDSAERVAKARKAIKDNPVPRKNKGLGFGPVSFINDRIGKDRDTPKDRPKKSWGEIIKRGLQNVADDVANTGERLRKASGWDNARDDYEAHQEKLKKEKEENKAKKPSSTQDPREKPWGISGPMQYDAPGTAKDRPEPARDKAHPRGEFTPERPPADRNKNTKEVNPDGFDAHWNAEQAKKAAEREAAPESSKDSSAVGWGPEANKPGEAELRDKEKATQGALDANRRANNPQMPESTRKRIDKEAAERRARANESESNQTMRDSPADEPSEPEIDFMSKFRKGTASNYDPNSSVDRAKMEALKAGKKDWATDKRERKSPVKATGPEPTPKEVEKPKRRRKTRRRR